MFLPPHNQRANVTSNLFGKNWRVREKEKEKSKCVRKKISGDEKERKIEARRRAFYLLRYSHCTKNFRVGEEINAKKGSLRKRFSFHFSRKLFFFLMSLLINNFIVHNSASLTYWYSVYWLRTHVSYMLPHYRHQSLGKYEQKYKKRWDCHVDQFFIIFKAFK